MKVEKRIHWSRKIQPGVMEIINVIVENLDDDELQTLEIIKDQKIITLKDRLLSYYFWHNPIFSIEKSKMIVESILLEYRDTIYGETTKKNEFKWKKCFIQQFNVLFLAPKS